jgi:predicted RNA methylase
MNLCHPGTELELFATATNWKRYIAALITPYIGETVLDVGAGIGGHVPFLCRHCVREWVCVEPDAKLASRLARRIADGELPAVCRVITERRKEGIAEISQCSSGIAPGRMPLPMTS